MTKPVIIGMNNPHSDHPYMALAPMPRRVAGWNLWSMLNDVRPTPRAEYMRSFDRRNLLAGRDWDAVAAARESEGLWDALQGRTVLVLGHPVRRVLLLTERHPLSFSTHRGVRWCQVPHPSGLNRWYNDPLNKLAVGMRLEELLETTCQEACDGVD